MSYEFYSFVAPAFNFYFFYVLFFFVFLIFCFFLYFVFFLVATGEGGDGVSMRLTRPQLNTIGDNVWGDGNQPNTVTKGGLG